jgi:aspartyl protease family protein
MLSWALRYLVMAVAVAIGFAALQGSDWLEPSLEERSNNRGVAAKPARDATSPRVRRTITEQAPSEDWVEQEAGSDAGEDDGWTDDSGWTDDDGWADDGGSASDDGWANDDGSASDDSGTNDDGWANDDGWNAEQSGAAPEQATDGLLELVIRAGPHGHFVVDAEVDGTPLTFLIDTGASDIVLSQADARRLGLEPRTLDYSRSYQTANGVVRAAPVQLRELRLGQLQLYELDASVNERPLPVSLLGMSFLSRLQGYEVTDGRLILRW